MAATTKNGKAGQDLEVLEGGAMGEEEETSLPRKIVLKRQVVCVQIAFQPLLGVREGIAIREKFPAFKQEEGLIEIEPTEEGFMRAFDLLTERMRVWQERVDTVAENEESESPQDRIRRVRSNR